MKGYQLILLAIFVLLIQACESSSPPELPPFSGGEEGSGEESAEEGPGEESAEEGSGEESAEEAGEGGEGKEGGEGSEGSEGT